jgi:hypothetical protein
MYFNPLVDQMRNYLRQNILLIEHVNYCRYPNTSARRRPTGLVTGNYESGCLGFLPIGINCVTNQQLRRETAVAKKTAELSGTPLAHMCGIAWRAII